MTAVEIGPDDPRRADVVALLTAHLEFAKAHSAPARALYARFGFVECEPFGQYRRAPASVCMTRNV